MRVSNLLATLASVSCCIALVSACGDDKKSTSTASNACAAPTDADFPANNPNSCSKTMFSKYQIDAFGKVNGDLINMAANPNQVSSLGDSFQTKIVQAGPARIASFTSNLAAFLVTAYGNPSDPNYLAYGGPSMTTAHAGLNITTAQYSYFVSSVIVPTLQADGVEASDISNCFAPTVLDPALMRQIITCH